MPDRLNNRILFSVFAGILIVCCIISLGGCNTMAGLGADISAAAKGIQDRMAEPDDPYATARN